MNKRIFELLRSVYSKKDQLSILLKGEFLKKSMTKNLKTTRLSKAAREFNVSTATIVEFLNKKGFELASNPNTKLSPEMYELVLKEYSKEKSVKEKAKIQSQQQAQIKKESISIDDIKSPMADEELKEDIDEDVEDTIIIKNANPPIGDDKEKASKTVVAEDKEPEKNIGPKILGKIELDGKKPKKTKKTEKADTEKVEVEEVKKEKIEVKVEEVEPTKPVKKTEEVKELPKEEPAKKEEVKAETVAPKAEKKVEVKVEKTVAEKKEEISKTDKKEAEKPAEKTTAKKKEAVKKEKEPVKEKVEQKKEAVKKEKPEIKAEKKEKTVVKAEKGDKPKVEKQKETTPSAKKTEKPKEEPQKKEEKSKEEDSNFLETKVEKLEGVKVLGTMELPVEKKKTDYKKKNANKKNAKNKKPIASSSDKNDSNRPKKKKRKRIPTANDNKGNQHQADNKNKRRKKKAQPTRHEPSEEEVQKQLKETLARLSGQNKKSKSSKYRKTKREAIQAKREKEGAEENRNVIEVTEFVTVNELATMMGVDVKQVISTCMAMGLFVSINQRIDAENITMLADEFGYEVEFVSADVQEALDQSDDIEENEEDLIERAPIVTVMGHVDHGKTSLLDFIRNANVIEGEAGGITQHIGAYDVKMPDGRHITFLDTPGHEAFTAMRARGAKVTDIVIIIIAADDKIMPQTIEAINHAQAAGVPIVFAINKIDKPGASPDRIKEELAQRNLLVEEWGGKYQSHDISAKKGIGIEELLEKVLLEAEMLELKGNPKRLAKGTVIESLLDKGRGYVAKLLVQDGTLRKGDYVLAGSNSGKVKAMYNERNKVIDEAGPSTPVLMLGLDGAPQAGDQFNVLTDEREAKSIANRRKQLQREMGIRTQKHITLDEIGRRIAVGDFKELNVIVKGDVDGSVEALSDALLKESTAEIQLNVIHKSVGQISESDVMLASASDAIIIGFQVRPSVGARKLAEDEQIDIRTYSVIYKAIEEIKSAMEGMLSPDIEEKITCNVEVREVFKISKVGSVAGCMVLDGVITRNTRVRIIRDGIVIYTGNLGSLKRFKDDVKEVKTNFECGLNIESFNDIKVGDIIEGFEEVEVSRKL